MLQTMDVVCHSWTLPWKFKNASNGMSCAEGVDFEWSCSYIKMEVWRIETFSSSQPSWHNQSNKNFFLLKTFDSLNQFIFGPKRTGKRSSFEKVAVVGNMAGFIWTFNQSSSSTNTKGVTMSNLWLSQAQLEYDLLRPETRRKSKQSCPRFWGGLN